MILFNFDDENILILNTKLWIRILIDVGLLCLRSFLYLDEDGCHIVASEFFEGALSKKGV